MTDGSRLLHPEALQAELGPAEQLALAHCLAPSAAVWWASHRPARRIWDLMVASQHYEAWVIAWPRGGAIELHDHGGTQGAVVVASGELTETVVVEGAGGRVETDTAVLPAGSSITIGSARIHDIVNLGPNPAISVHVYSPRLASMTYYDISAGRLAAGRTDYWRAGGGRHGGGGQCEGRNTEDRRSEDRRTEDRCSEDRHIEHRRSEDGHGEDGRRGRRSRWTDRQRAAVD